MKVLSLVVAAASLVALQGFSAPSSGKGVSAAKENRLKEVSDDIFVSRNFASTGCDDGNNPPALKILTKSIQHLCSQGSDIRGRFVDHPRLGRMSQAAHAITKAKAGVPALTPFAAFCLGHAFAQVVLQQQQQQQQTEKVDEVTTIAIGRDPRQHGVCLSDAFARGAQATSKSIRVVYTGIASTPSMYHFCR